jgi:hypothetical protein
MDEFTDWVKGIPVRFFRRMKKPEQQITTPEQLQKVFDEARSKTFDDNPSQRDENSSWKRPAKQVSLAVLDGQIKIVRKFLSYQAAEVVKQVGKSATHTAAWQTSKSVISKMTGDCADVLNTTLAHSAFGKNLFKFLGSSSFKKGLLREGNFVLMALIDVLIVSGIYDGMDLDTIKDNVVAIGPLKTDWTYDEQIPGALMTDFINRQLYAGFGGKFDVIYQKALSSKNVWGQALKNLDDKAAILGNKLFKATRVGAETVKGQSMADKLGLVGVGEGVKFTLGGLIQRLAVGGAYAIIGDITVESAWALVRGFQNRVTLGGNRDKYWARQDLNAHQYQKTGNKYIDGWRQRQIRLRMVFEKRVKWPVKSMAVPVTTLLGGYMGSVIAGALFIGGGALPMVGGALISSLFAGIGNYVGNWASVKFDRSEFMMKKRHKNYVKRISREMKDMPEYESGQLTDADVDYIANERADDFEKIEKIGQVSCNILIVNYPHNILMGKKGKYWKMVIEDENGSEFEQNADIRYDVIDLDGFRWIYDIHTNKVRNVGKVSANNGRNIVFLNSKGVLVEDDVITNKAADDKTRTLHIFDNGLILEKREDGDWVIRGQASDRDILFRDTGERFEWKDGAFRRAAGPGRAGVVKAAQSEDYLAPYFPLVDEAEDEVFLSELKRIRSSQLAAARETLYKDIDSTEALEARAQDMVAIAIELGIISSEDEVDESVMNALSNESEAVKNMLKGRAERFIGSQTDEINRLIEETPIADLRATLQRVKTEYPITTSSGSIYSGLRKRFDGSPIWGRLSVVADSNAVLVLALMAPR